MTFDKRERNESSGRGGGRGGKGGAAGAGGFAKKKYLFRRRKFCKFCDEKRSEERRVGKECRL